MKHNCGLCVAHTLHDAYNYIESLQHRGREAAGIAAIGKGRIDVIKWKGSVSSFGLKDLYKIFNGSDYQTYMAHVRYATRGRKDEILEDAHPHVIGGTEIDKGSHKIILDADLAIVHNGQINCVHAGDCDTKYLLNLYRDSSEYELVNKIVGSYTLAIADKNENYILATRDRAGLRPGVLGFKDGKHVIVSEDIALRQNGSETIEDLTPGYVYRIYLDGNYNKKRVIKNNCKHCFFEWNYIAHPGSVLNGVGVHKLRELLGHKLAEEFRPTDADFVTYLPRCPEISARSYSESASLDFIPIFYKMKSERSFQGSTSNDRNNSIKDNLHVLPHMERLLVGKTVILLDDSIIRGTNLRRACELLRACRVKKIYAASYTPPIGITPEDGVPRGCMFGVDMPPDDNFIARDRTIKEIGEKAGVEVYYLSREGMITAFADLGMPTDRLCSYCIGGDHPYEGSNSSSS